MKIIDAMFLLHVQLTQKRRTRAFHALEHGEGAENRERYFQSMQLEIETVGWLRSSVCVHGDFFFM